ncbi:MAG: ribosome silencing factor [Hydrogenophilus sp.]|nr:ribosome silencing factor [Hydrogenophilus sp.]
MVSSANSALTVSQLTQYLIAVLEATKGEAIEAYDTTPLTPLFERVILVTGNSIRHVKALARHLIDETKKIGIPILGVEGEAVGEWVLIDFGSVVVHIMLPAVRAYYRLEELWGTPPAVRVAAAAVPPWQPLSPAFPPDAPSPS